MSEEEKKAIEVLKNVDVDLSGNIVCSKCVKLDNKTCREENGEDCQVHSIKTVLNLIQKQQTELEKKDKMIDLMSEEISNNICNTCPYKDYNYDLNCENRCSNDDDLYSECWKIYFERKVEND